MAFAFRVGELVVVRDDARVPDARRARPAELDLFAGVRFVARQHVPGISDVRFEVVLLAFLGDVREEPLLLKAESDDAALVVDDVAPKRVRKHGDDATRSVGVDRERREAFGAQIVVFDDDREHSLSDRQIERSTTVREAEETVGVDVLRLRVDDLDDLRAEARSSSDSHGERENKAPALRAHLFFPSPRNARPAHPFRCVGPNAPFTLGVTKAPASFLPTPNSCSVEGEQASPVPPSGLVPSSVAARTDGQIGR